MINETEKLATETLQAPRRAVKLNAETLRALEAQDQNPTIYTSFCTNACTTPQTCRTCSTCTPGCPI